MIFFNKRPAKKSFFSKLITISKVKMYNLREKKSKISFRSEVVIDYSFGEERIRDDKRFNKTTKLDLWKYT